jgi:hypothetical protein
MLLLLDRRDLLINNNRVRIPTTRIPFSTIVFEGHPKQQKRTHLDEHVVLFYSRAYVMIPTVFL